MNGIVQAQTLIKSDQEGARPGSFLSRNTLRLFSMKHLFDETSLIDCEVGLEMASNVVQAIQEFCQIPKFIADFKQP